MDLTGLYVPPVFLSVHLILALSLFAYLVWLASYVLGGNTVDGLFPANLKKSIWIAFTLLFIQVFLGGIMSGMKAGLAYPTWPDMNGEFIPSAFSNLSPTLQGIFHYDPADFWGRTLIQFIHRAVAYILAILILWISFSAQKTTATKSSLVGFTLLPFSVLLQVAIGIFTVLYCIGEIPVFWGVLHQAGAMLLIANLSFLVYRVRK
jgi:cytochrome c oxidase assembly protein subunit 15